MTLAFGMPGPVELIVIGVIAVLVFGSKLPKIARSVGSSFVEFKRGVKHGIEDPADDLRREAREIGEELRL